MVDTGKLLSGCLSNMLANQKRGLPDLCSTSAHLPASMLTPSVPANLVETKPILFSIAGAPFYIIVAFLEKSRHDINSLFDLVGDRYHPIGIMFIGLF